MSFITFIYPVDENMFLAKAAVYFPAEFFSIVPLELKSVQLLAQWIVIVEAAFVMHFCLRVIIRIVTLILETAFAMILLAAIYYFYNQNAKDPQ
jgi:predicted neutral ceramidase superfamily lipid hydrolase